MFKDLTIDQINKIAGTILSTALLSAGTMIFGQLTTGKPFSFLLAVLGYALGTYAAWFCGQILMAVAII